MSNHEGSEEMGREPQTWASGGPIRHRVGLVCLACGVAAWFGDAWVRAQAGVLSQNLGGDVRRELEAAQQFGGLGSLIVVVLMVWLMDPGRRRRLLDLVAAAALTGVAVQFLKMFLGRPRPLFEDPGMLLWPWGAYPMENVSTPGIYHAWEFWEPIGSGLWSMPSSHTSAAVALAVWLGVVYPSIRPLMIGWVVLVALSRVVFGAHYLSDVFIGAGAGFVVSHAAVRGYWGVRILDWLWVRLVDRKASPALANMLEHDS